ncbi:MAG TPA: hypothetical protein VK013_15740 [Myxococcaceae bacterium]|nr:hypothetical protein [Myxococcaceae bacterium]
MPGRAEQQTGRTASVPSLPSHLRLLFGLRGRLALNESARRPVATVFSTLAACVPGLLVGLLLYWLLGAPLIRTSVLWTSFVLSLLGFVTACVWFLWPILSAGVDDHSELSRYVNFPLPGRRLLLASTLAAMFEPRTLFFSAPLIGATLGVMGAHPPVTLPYVIPLLLSYLLMCATMGRVGLHLMLNLLTSRRSAQLLGGGMVLFLVGASLLPPVDVQWLEDAGTVGLAALGPDFLERAAIALSRIPTGWHSRGLVALALERPGVALWYSFWMLMVAALAFWVAHRLLVRFHQGAVRGGASSSVERAHNPFVKPKGVFGALVVREALDLWNHPRARLLACVPFILAILIKLLSGQELFAYLLGGSSRAWLAGGLGMYGALVMTSTFAQNAFAYDGHGLAALWAAPISPEAVLRAKNLVHATAGLLLAALSLAFYALYFGDVGPLTLLTAFGGCAALVGVLVIVGNQLSLTFPVKFHADLRKRDRLPLPASLLGIVGAIVGGVPYGLAMRMAGDAPPGVPSLLVVAGGIAVVIPAYFLLQPNVARRLGRARERILGAVTRS